METQNTNNNAKTTWVRCPYCLKLIQAPNQPDVTFPCPNCGKELLTYEKERTNNSRLIENAEQKEIPKNIDKWNWGAFFLSWIWGIMNGVYWPLYVALVFLFLYLVAGTSMSIDFLWFIVYTGMSIALGINGNKWAWKAKHWNSADDFQETQRKWSFAGLCLFGITIFILFIAIVFFQAAIFTSLS